MKKYESLVEELKGFLPEYMGQKGVLVRGKRNKMIRCINPLHEDRHPSMSYNERSRTLHCFSCGANYDLFDVIGMDYPDCNSFPRQVRKACELFGKAFPADFGRDGDGESAPARAPQARKAPAPAVRMPEPPREPAADYTEQIERQIRQNGIGGAYFEKRGISRALCEKYRLHESGGRAVLPIYSGGRCACYCARATNDAVKPRYKNSPGGMGLFGADALLGEGRDGVLFITEAVFDALSAEECGYQAVALCGVANVRKFLALCRANPAAANHYTFIAAGDGDAPGREMNRALGEGLAALGLECRALELPEGCKDLNELLVRDREALRECLARAANADRYLYEQTSAAGALPDLLDFSLRWASRHAQPTGFPKLDDILDGGFYAGLYILGAISSLGKTSFVLQIADSVAAQGGDVLFFSLEMSRLELMSKSISRISYRMDPTAGRADAFTARQVLRLEEGMDARRGLLLNDAVEEYKRIGAGMFLRESIGEIGVGEIRRAVREHIRLRGKRPLVVVDYLQILQPADPRATDKQNTDRAVVELKRVSRDFDLPVLAISSFNRENYRNSVSMEAFKESGAVEYSSDVLLGLQLAGAGEPGFDVNAAKSRSPRAVELVMLKNRNGLPYAKIEYGYDARFSCFVEGARVKK